MDLYKKIAIRWSLFCVAGFVVNFLILVVNHFNALVEHHNFSIGARLLMVCWIWIGMWVAIAGPNALIFFMTLKGLSKWENHPQDSATTELKD